MNAPRPDLAERRAALKRRLEDLRSAAAATTDDRKPVELDQTSVGRVSRVDAMQVQAMALATERIRQGEMRRIEAALKRIESGEYGDCVRCGEEIAPARLDVDPAVPTCMACAKAKQ